MPAQPILLETTQNGLCILTLNRPEKHNAFNPELITALSNSLQSATEDKAVRALLLRAEGRHFCAGADLNWMKETAGHSTKENQRDALHLADLLHRLHTLPKPTVALVQGRAMGGGIGLLACCDMVFASDDARFCFSEVKLGLIPATISPYVIQRIGYAAARRYFMSAELLDIDEAQRLQLVDRIVKKDQLLDTATAFVEQLKTNGPQAMAAAKQLVSDLAYLDRKTIHETAKRLAAIRSSEEAQEGMKAFFEKRPPEWTLKS